MIVAFVVLIVVASFALKNSKHLQNYSYPFVFMSLTYHRDWLPLEPESESSGRHLPVL